MSTHACRNPRRRQPLAVEVLENRLTPSFTPATGSPFALPTGAAPQFTVLGDFNEDTHLDIATANPGTGNVSVLFGAGDGTFESRLDVPAGTNPTGIAVGDFNEDTNLDIVVTNHTDPGGVTVLFGDGMGAFPTSISFTVGSLPVGVAVGDFDGDDDLDVAVANSGDDTITLIFGVAATDITVISSQASGGTAPQQIAAGNFNGDTIADLAVTNAGSDTVGVFLGQSLGDVTPAGSLAVGAGPAGIAAGDLDGDTILDLAVANNGSNSVSVLLGNGDGSFGAAANFAVGSAPVGLAIADVSPDSRLDIVTANSGSNNVSVLPNLGGGAFATAFNTSSGGTAPHGIAAGNLDIDTRADLAIANNGSDNVSVLLRGPDVIVVDGTAGNDTFSLFVDPVLGPAYQVNSGPVTPLVDALEIIFNGMDGDDTLTVDLSDGDPIPTDGVTFNGDSQTATPGDRLDVIGDGSDVGAYNPSAATPGDGTVQIAGKGTIVFTGLEPMTVSNMASFTLTTPNSDDVLTIDSPAAGQNRISGTSGGVGFEALTFFDVAAFILDTGTNDGVLPNDQITLDATGLVASGLVDFTVSTGAGADSLTVQSTSYATPGSTTGFSFNGGADGDTFFGNADISYTLTDTQLTSSGGGSIQFMLVDQVDLTDGTSANEFRLDFGNGVTAIPVNGVAIHSIDGNDAVVLADGGGFTADTIEHSFGAIQGDGLITVDGRTVSYAGIGAAAGVTDELVADNRVFTFTAASDMIQITDDGIAGDGISRIRGQSTTVITDYRNPAIQITVNGGDGSDNFTDPTFDTLGAPPTANLNGRDGGPGTDASDLFTITPSAVTAFNIEADDPAPPTGDSLTVTTTGTANPFLTISSGASGLSGSFTFDDRQPVNFQEIETLGNTVDLTITKDDSPDPVTAGTTVTYDIVVSNNGPLGVAGVAVVDTFPATLTSVSFTSVATGGATSNAGAGTGDINDIVSLPVGSTITYTVTATVAASATGTLTNTATVTQPSGVADSAPSDNSSTETTTVNTSADLAVTQVASPDPVNVTGNVTYTITLRNDGPSDAQGVALVAGLPAHTTFVSFAAPAGFTPTTPAMGGTGNVRATATTLAAGAEAVFTLVVRVDAQAPANAPLATTVNVSGTTTDPTSGNNSATATTHVAQVSFIAVGAAQGSRVTVYNSAGARVVSFLAFGANFAGGVRVAVGDVNGDGVSDIIVAAGPSAGPHVKVIDGTRLGGLSPSRTVPGAALLSSFFAYQKGFTGGVSVAAGDVNGDGRDDIITGQGSGAGRVRVIDAARSHLRLRDGRISPAALLGAFLPYRPGFRGGVVVAAGDVNGDDRADVLVGPASGPAPIRIVDGAGLAQFQPAALIGSFFVYPPDSNNGVSLATGFVNGDNRADIIIGGGAGQQPSVRVIDGTRIDFVDAQGRITPHASLANRLIFARAFRDGVHVGALDLDGDGLAEVLAGSGPTQRRILGLDMLRNAARERTIVVDFNAGSLGGN
ncbi:MAG: FG-GAP-like repeat-containing protein [Gemmataceae bacterium]|nr:FG-GAP-like repeat-containing protein [Gemmataceae bacterium]